MPFCAWVRTIPVPRGSQRDWVLVAVEPSKPGASKSLTGTEGERLTKLAKDTNMTVRKRVIRSGSDCSRIRHRERLSYFWAGDVRAGGAGAGTDQGGGGLFIKEKTEGYKYLQMAADVGESRPET